MKSLFTLAFASLFATTAAHAEYRVGLIGGANFAKMHLSEGITGSSANTSSNTNFMGGVTVEYPMAGGVDFMPGIRYNQKGGAAVISNQSAALTLKYLEIPMYAKYRVMTGTPVMPFVFAGPNLAFKVGSSATNTVTGGTVTGLDGFKTVDFLVDAGLGAEVSLNDKINVSLSGAYSWGLVNTLSTSIADASATNRGFQLYAGVSYVY